MKKRLFALVLSIIMLITSFIGAMPVSAASNKKTTTTKTTTTSESKQLYVVPFDNNYAAVRETPSTTEKHPIQIMAYSRGDYCLYTGKYVLVEKTKDKIKDVNNNGAKEYEKWYMVETLWGQSGYVVEWAGQIVDKKPTKPSASTTASTTTSSTKKTSTTTTVNPSTTKKITTTTVKKTTTTSTKSATTTTTKKTTSKLYYLTSKGNLTYIRAKKSTASSKIGEVKVKNFIKKQYDVVVADGIEKDKNGVQWYHIINFNGKEGWMLLTASREVPAPATTVSTTTTSKTTTTTAKKPETTTTKPTTTSPTTKSTTKKPATTTTKPISLYFDLGKGGKTQLDNVKVVNRTKIQVGFSYDPNTNTLYIDSVG